MSNTSPLPSGLKEQGDISHRGRGPSSARSPTARTISTTIVQPPRFLHTTRVKPVVSIVFRKPRSLYHYLSIHLFTRGFVIHFASFPMFLTASCLPLHEDRSRSAVDMSQDLFSPLCIRGVRARPASLVSVWGGCCRSLGLTRCLSFRPADRQSRSVKSMATSSGDGASCIARSIGLRTNWPSRRWVMPWKLCTALRATAPTAASAGPGSRSSRVVAKRRRQWRTCRRGCSILL